MQIPGHIQWQDTHGVAIDFAGLIYVKHRTMTVEPQDAIVILIATAGSCGRSGKSSTEADMVSTSAGTTAKSSCICVITKVTSRRAALWGRLSGIYTSTRDRTLQRCPAVRTGDSGKIRQGLPVLSNQYSVRAPDGGFWVGDGYGSHFIIKYDKDAKPVDHFGGIGNGPGELQTPHGLWWDDEKGGSRH